MGNFDGGKPLRSREAVPWIRTTLERLRVGSRYTVGALGRASAVVACEGGA